MTSKENKSVLLNFETGRGANVCHDKPKNNKIKYNNFCVKKATKQMA